jgi:hypothetical protein
MSRLVLSCDIEKKHCKFCISWSMSWRKSFCFGPLGRNLVLVNWWLEVGTFTSKTGNQTVAVFGVRCPCWFHTLVVYQWSSVFIVHPTEPPRNLNSSCMSPPMIQPSVPQRATSLALFVSHNFSPFKPKDTIISEEGPISSHLSSTHYLLL